MNILIVDDSRTMRSLIIRELNKTRIPLTSVLQADDAESALKIVSQESLHMILTDWHMKKMSGLEFIKQVKEAHPTIPIGMITSERDESMKQQVISEGAGFILNKPVKAASLEVEILKLLKKTYKS